jgi:16S rRNA (guanine966-N2)-methyltransferase
VRVVAGSARGRRLVAPPGRATRPTSDRVREAVFASLESAGLVTGARVVDLFAGSGAMGIEALSRGAAHATFVESAPAALVAIRANLVATGLAARAEVVRADVLRWLGTAPAPGPFDLAFVDPPYAFDRWDELLDRLPAAVAVLEAAAPVAVSARWEVLRERRYGGTVVQTISRRGEP